MENEAPPKLCVSNCGCGLVYSVAFPAVIQHITSHSLVLNMNSPNITVGCCEHPVFVDQRPAAKVTPLGRLDGDNVLDEVLSWDVAAHYPAFHLSMAWRLEGNKHKTQVRLIWNGLEQQDDTSTEQFQSKYSPASSTVHTVAGMTTPRVQMP